MKRLVLPLNIFFFCVSQSLAAPSFPPELTDEQIQQSYSQTQHFFFQRLCIPGTEEKFWKLFSSYRAEGLYVPTFKDQELDLPSIRSNLDHLREKRQWLEKLNLKLRKKKDFRKELALSKSILQLLDEILVLQYREVVAPSGINRQEIKNKLLTLKQFYRNLIAEIDYLLPFKYPQDYLQLRINYDQLKQQIAVNYQRDLEHRSNDLFFFRQIVEDGANEENGTGADFYLRTTFSTIELQLAKPLDQLTENLRYDLVDILEKIQNHWLKGVHYFQKRHDNWILKTEKQLAFYQGLLRAKKGVQTEFLRNKASSLHQLQEFVWQHLGLVYQFWADYPLWYQYLFAMETIFTNEVGRLDGPGGVERLDVAQVVLNRSRLPEFWQMDPAKVAFFGYVAPAHLVQWEKYLWTNLLLRPGEFSFTYYYIPSVIRIFCPEMTSIGQKRRAENVQLAVWAAKNPQPSFQALRYFSRASMTGRIDMSAVWTDYRPYPERSGVAVESERQKKLSQQLQAGEFKYFYSISDRLQVFQISDVEFVYDQEKKFFYYHRNPHYFTYFEKNTSP